MDKLSILRAQKKATMIALVEHDWSWSSVGTTTEEAFVHALKRVNLEDWIKSLTEQIRVEENK